MHTKDLLAQALTDAGLAGMAVKAAEGYYHDYLSPLDTPALQLLDDLKKIGSPEAMSIRRRVMNGEFDASKEEGDEWAKSPEGQEAYRMLTQYKGKR